MESYHIPPALENLSKEEVITQLLAQIQQKDLLLLEKEEEIEFLYNLVSHQNLSIKDLSDLHHNWED